MATDSEKIKSMKLYSEVDRIYNELKEIGFSRDSALTVDDVSKFDQYHYFGTKTIDGAISRLSLQPGQMVLDVGAGLGGPARYLAARCGCHVVAVELQADLHLTGLDLTCRCGLADNVRHVHADFLMDHFDCDPVDALTSWLVFLHIPEKAKLFHRCRETLKRGGKMYIEDYFVQGEPTEREKDIMDKCCFSLETKEQYVKHLTDAGFSHIQFDDVTAEWASCVTSRAEEYRAARKRHERVHGERVYTDQQEFYDLIRDLFKNGTIRGCCITSTAE